MIQIDIPDRHLFGIGHREPWVVTRRRTEDHHVAYCSRKPLMMNAYPAVRKFLGRHRTAPKPHVVGPKCRFAFLCVEFQQAGEWINRPLGISKTQTAVNDVAEIVIGKFKFEPIRTFGHDDSFGMKRARIVDTQVADCDITAVGDAERRNESRKEQFRTIAFDGKIPHSAQIESDAFQAFIVIADKLVFFHRLVGTQTEPASRQYEPRSA